MTVPGESGGTETDVPSNAAHAAAVTVTVSHTKTLSRRHRGPSAPRHTSPAVPLQGAAHPLPLPVADRYAAACARS